MESANQQAAAIVCGSTTPLGAELIDRFTHAGIAVVAIDPPGASADTRASARFSIDPSDEHAWLTTAAAISQGTAQPAMLVYALTVSDGSLTALALPLAEWDRVIDTNLRGAYLACKHLLPLLRPADSAATAAAVLLGSVLAEWDAQANSAALAASGGGIVALGRSLALAGAPIGVRVNTVCYPAPLPHAEGDSTIAIERIPTGRPTSAADVADAVMFLLSQDAAYITGSVLLVDGGQTLQSWSNAPE